MSGFITHSLRTIVCFITVVSLGTASPVLAQSEPDGDAKTWPTHTIAVSNSPITITRCTTRALTGVMMGNGAPIATINAYNRTSMHLVKYSVQYTMYDHDGNVMGKPVFTFEPSNTLPPHDLDEGEQAQLGGAFSSVSLSEPQSALASITCRINGAQFEGNHIWTYGHAWTGKLGAVPATAPQDFTDPSSSKIDSSARPSSISRQTLGLPPVSLAPTNAWNDTVGGNLLVHVALDVQGGASDATLMPANLTLTMALANGAKKQYPAMPVAAPTYAKLNALGDNTTAYEVDPKEDLGRLGSVIVPAHGTVKIVATFFVGSDVVANANDNRQVGLK